MTYQETLQYLYSQLPMYQRVGAQAYKKDLSNTLFLLKALDNPETAYPSIHIAGTNGKGSVTHMLSACYQAAGLKVGMYTSPHYRDFRERIKINGKTLSKAAVVRFVDRIRGEMESCKPSFFEITVAMAFDEFRRQKVDIAIIETGLGGRLDSTNVIRPILSVITNIGYDHQAMLGDTLPLIAREKAGIIKDGVPVVIGTTQKETAPVFRENAQRKETKVYFADRQLQARLLHKSIDRQTYHISHNNQVILDNLDLDHGGAYQLANLRTTILALKVLVDNGHPLTPDEKAIREGLANLRTLTQFQGRWQILGHDPVVLADSAHNTHGLSRVLKQLKEIPKRKLHFVLGFVNDKDIESALSLFPKKAEFYFARPDIPRGLDVQELANRAGKLGLQGKVYHSVPNALEAAKKMADREDLIYVGGSSFVVAEVIP